jgi:hypothetical protein
MMINRLVHFIYLFVDNIRLRCPHPQFSSVGSAGDLKYPTSSETEGVKKKNLTHHSLIRSDNVADAASSVQTGEIPGAGAGAAVDYESVRGAADSDICRAAGERNSARFKCQLRVSGGV